MERTPSGVEGLDFLIEGGFPKGSLIVVAGNPGTGKTIFSSEFLYQGAVQYGDKGVLVSLIETRESFINNMRRLGMDFEPLEKEGKIRILDMTTLREEAIPSLLSMVLDAV